MGWNNRDRGFSILLTVDRPCERCVARGFADSCRDGTRKKAKYLEDVPEAVAMSSAYQKYDPRFKKQGELEDLNAATKKHTIDSHSEGTSGITPPVSSLKLEDESFAVPNRPLQYERGFLSNAATKEYDALGSMVNSNQISNSPGFFSETSPNTAASDDTMRSGEGTTANKAAAAILHSELLNQYSIGNTPGHSLSDVLDSLDTAAGIQNERGYSDWLQDEPKPRPISLAISNAGSPVMYPLQYSPTNSSSLNSTRYQSLGEFQEQTPEMFRPTNHHHHPHMETTQQPDFARLNSSTRPADIYLNIRKPFPYTPGFRALSIYLKGRFPPENLIKIAQFMAKYRPSFIACTNSLNEDDLIFMEQCFQRALLEYEKFISFSGTPTVIWRRTGQIASVGKEFCILTGWSREKLLGVPGKSNCMFIVELMDDSSVLKYFEMFSNYAFGDSRAPTIECTLRTNMGKSLKTVSQWTMKRDVFGIPMMVIGNFLPILP